MIDLRRFCALKLAVNRSPGGILTPPSHLKHQRRHRDVAGWKVMTRWSRAHLAMGTVGHPAELYYFLCYLHIFPLVVGTSPFDPFDFVAFIKVQKGKASGDD